MTQTSDEKTVEKNEELRRVQAEAASASGVAADAESKATAELREKHRAEYAEELREEAVKGTKGFGGQVVYTDNFVAVTTEAFGRQVVEIKPAGWVGEGFVVSAMRVKELAKLVGQVKHLPEQD